jgi:8-oxo-dGTP pyrophosphatase MutT (NUDIX family)
MEKYCDNQSVGVVLRHEAGGFALLKRARFPIGIAPPAGHIDTHGNPEQAAVEEVGEELGVKLAVSALRQTAIFERRVDNVCRRVGGGFHIWNVYEATTDAVALHPDKDETHGAAWYSSAAVRALAERTWRFQQGKIGDSEWESNPGLEPVWLDFLSELGHIE